MFSDRYGLTQAVLEGRKTMTRRIITKEIPPCKDPYPYIAYDDDYKDFLVYKNDNDDCPIVLKTKYKPGEVVAVARSYKNSGFTKESIEFLVKPNPKAKNTDPFEKRYPGWNNKMFVLPHLMPQIQITDIKVEILQDISYGDCLKEGITPIPTYIYSPVFSYEGFLARYWFGTPHEAFAALIDKVCGKGTWERNPYVFAYEFKLIN